MKYLLLVALAWGSPAVAQNWPTKTVTFVVPFAAGAAADIGARIVANELSTKWKQPVIVENKPGGDNLIAVRSVVTSGDSHVMLFTGTGNFTVHPFKYKTLDYNRHVDLIPVAGISSTLVNLVASSASGITTVEQMVEQARKSPGKLTVVLIPGITELVWDSFAKSRKLDITKVPYSNIMSGMQDLSIGRLDIALVGYAISQPVLQANAVKVLAVTAGERVGLLPDAPTTREAGFDELTYDGLVGLFANKILDKALIPAISKDVVQAASSAQVTERLLATGQIPKAELAPEFTKSVEAQEALIKRIVETYDIQPK
jgi:tripartite-type tricarboxylate transporter receptor subunit TctC